MGRKHSGIEAQILRAAETIFSERGYQATTLDDLVIAARISRATFYNYFPSKDELLRRMYRQVISSTQVTIERITGEVARRSCSVRCVPCTERSDKYEWQDDRIKSMEAQITLHVIRR